MAAPRTFVEHDILSIDAERGTFYKSFEEFWDQRMEPMQFIPREAQGVFAALRQTLKDRAEEQWILWVSAQIPADHPSWHSTKIAALPTGAVTNCGGSPQAGQGRHPIDNASSLDVYPEEPSYG